MLHLEKALVNKRLALPCMDVLTDKCITNQFEHLPYRYSNVVPGLIFANASKRVLINVVINGTRTRPFHLLLVISSTGVAAT